MLDKLSLVKTSVLFMWLSVGDRTRPHGPVKLTQKWNLQGVKAALSFNNWNFTWVCEHLQVTFHFNLGTSFICCKVLQSCTVILFQVFVCCVGLVWPLLCLLIGWLVGFDWAFPSAMLVCSLLSWVFRLTFFHLLFWARGRLSILWFGVFVFCCLLKTLLWCYLVSLCFYLLVPTLLISVY